MDIAGRESVWAGWWKGEMSRSRKMTGPRSSWSLPPYVRAPLRYAIRRWAHSLGEEKKRGPSLLDGAPHPHS